MGNSTSNNFNFDEEISLLGRYIKNVHIKDRFFDKATTVPLGTGNTDFKNVFKKLIDINYQGDYILQCARKDINNIEEKSNPIETIKLYFFHTKYREINEYNFFWSWWYWPKTFKDNKKIKDPHQKSMHTEVQIISLR